MQIVPITLRESNQYVSTYHRHHGKCTGCKFCLGLTDDTGTLVGVAICGRLVSRHLDDGFTIEINRLCTDGTRNACSMLYSACVRVAKAMGYCKVITYILKSENGASLKASNFIYDGEAGGEIWTGCRKRDNGVPKELKQRWVYIITDIDLYKNILEISADEILEKFGKPDVIWASPDCTTFSIAAISHHRKVNVETGNLDPISDYAKFCDEVDQHVLHLIDVLAPKYYFIENPRGGLRKMAWMSKYPRYTVTYCAYGDTRMKPTDIWTNHPNPQFKPPCKNGDTCHISAPRGSRTGTQGLKDSKERSIIPSKLCEHIVSICENPPEPDGFMSYGSKMLKPKNLF